MGGRSSVLVAAPVSPSPIADSVRMIAAYEIEMATGITVTAIATDSPPGMRKRRGTSGRCTRSATNDHMKRQTDGTDSSIENSTRIV